MASKYIQKFPIPTGFPEILNDFAKEILRNQPQDIIEFSAEYFKCLQEGTVLDYNKKGANLPNDFKVSVPKMPEKENIGKKNVATEFESEVPSRPQVNEVKEELKQKPKQEQVKPEKPASTKKDVEGDILTNQERPFSNKSKKLDERISEEDKSKLNNLSHNFVENLWQSKSIEFESKYKNFTINRRRRVKSTRKRASKAKIEIIDEDWKTYINLYFLKTKMFLYRTESILFIKLSFLFVF